MNLNEIKRDIEKVKAAYREGQVERKLGNLTRLSREITTKEQIERVERLKALGNLLNQRYGCN